MGPVEAVEGERVLLGLLKQLGNLGDDRTPFRWTEFRGSGQVVIAGSGLEFFPLHAHSLGGEQVGRDEDPDAASTVDDSQLQRLPALCNEVLDCG